MDRLTRRIKRLLLAWFHRSCSGLVPYVRRFQYKDIRRATNRFDRIIYSSAHSIAYRARFQSGEIVLVKEVRAFDREMDIFYQEVQHLGRLHHRHILALRGFSTGPKRLLVFDNIGNGTLKEHLSDPLKTPLNWKTRVQIFSGVVAALEYLSFFCSLPLYHVSINSSNIMLDENFTAKVSDISLQSFAISKTPCSKAFKNHECGNVIFQLGVLILELVTGQCSEQGGSDLIDWVQQSSFSSSIHKMLDPDLGNDYSCRELKKLLAVARLCIRSKEKPAAFSISHVFSYLRQRIEASPA